MLVCSASSDTDVSGVRSCREDERGTGGRVISIANSLVLTNRGCDCVLTGGCPKNLRLIRCARLLLPLQAQKNTVTQRSQVPEKMIRVAINGFSVTCATTACARPRLFTELLPLGPGTTGLDGDADSGSGIGGGRCVGGQGGIFGGSGDDTGS